MSMQALAVRESFSRVGKGPIRLVSSVPAAGLFDLMGAPLAYSRNEEVYGEGEPAEYLYTVTSGCVRTSKISRRPPPDRRLLLARRRFRIGSR